MLSDFLPADKMLCGLQDYAHAIQRRNGAAAEAMQAESQLFDTACTVEELQARAAASKVNYSCQQASHGNYVSLDMPKILHGWPL